LGDPVARGLGRPAHWVAGVVKHKPGPTPGFYLSLLLHGCRIFVYANVIGSEAVQPLRGTQPKGRVPWPAGPDVSVGHGCPPAERSSERLAGWFFYFLRRVLQPNGEQLLSRKKSKTLVLPNISSEFALIDVKEGRESLAKVVAKGYRVPFTITGFVQAGPNADGVSIEFCADVTTAQFGTPELDNFRASLRVNQRLRRL
jgi:hypothetical protein